MPLRFCAAILIQLLLLQAANSQTRTVIALKEGWKFAKGNNPQAFQTNFNDKDWQTVAVPHDWAINGPFDKEIDKQVVAITQNGEKQASEKTGRTGALPYIGEGWYRKTVELAPLKKSEKAIILFDGAMSEPRVYLNGQKVGEWNYGYNYFYLDITNQLASNGKNVLAVHLNNVSESSRWYPGAGLYRNVRIEIKNEIGIEQWGTYITTPFISAELAKVKIKTKTAGKDLKLVTEILDANNKRVSIDTAGTKFGNEFEQDLAVKNPMLWSPETPYLYKAISRIYVKGQLKDQLTSKFGIRQISYLPSTGFSLNGQSRKFKGVCLHHDLGPLGAAINIAALRRQLRILKDMGCDAIRSSHNMPSQEQLDLCDEMGFLFLAETFDEWAKPKVKNGYARYFNTDAEKDVVNMVHATRNHPCIVMWSSGNEVPDQHYAEGVKRAKWLQEIFHREDPTRPVTVGMDQVKATIQNGFGAILDIPGLNYRTKLYDDAFKAFPQGFLLGSETASTVSSRGIYKFPVKEYKNKQYPDNQSSSYDLEYCDWSNLPDEQFALIDDKPWVLGEFVWTGFDYLGEPTPYDEQWPSRSSYFGINDLAGLPKDRFYLYKSRWNTKENTLHILPHWNWAGREGETTPVFVYTNYDKAELFVNGKSMGVQQKNNSSWLNRYRLMWMDVKYEPGTVKVVAYDKQGKAVMEKSIVTADSPNQLVLEADRKQIDANGDDLSFVTVTVVDKNGNPCPIADNELSFGVTGAGSFKAVCNGDASSLVPFQSTTMKAFSGKLVVLVQSSKQAGDITLTVTGKGIKTGSIKLQSSK
jgi:beta-galactosidase